jgi:hypothetical protein
MIRGLTRRPADQNLQGKTREHRIGRQQNSTGTGKYYLILRKNKQPTVVNLNRTTYAIANP